MTTPMVRTLTAALIQRGLRSGTILGYMSAMAIWAPIRLLSIIRRGY